MSTLCSDSNSVMIVAREVLMSRPIVILWFRQDLRLTDNPALCAAVQAGEVYPVYILEDQSDGTWQCGGAGRWWLHQSLNDLNRQLGGHLNFFSGQAKEILPVLARQLDARAIYWNRCYEPWRIDRDRGSKEHLQAAGIKVHSFNGSLLWEPWEVLKKDGAPYRVFTPYYRKGCLGSMPPRQPLAAPAKICYLQTQASLQGRSLADLGLLPRHPWYKKLEQYWRPGEAGAQNRLRNFLEKGLAGYQEGRDYPAREQTSKLSPALHFGEISPHQLWHAARTAGSKLGCERDLNHFLSELAWREFSYYQLYHFPHLMEQPLRPEFQHFPWVKDEQGLRCWQRGQTGIPLVDAGMRELWQTGFMHNRVRMVVASFLVKNQLIHWHEGEHWFRDCLVDADPASNSAGWQWVAGCGVDAAPYFRIFNPVTQGERFDASGSYVRRFVPELRLLPDSHLHAPWTAPAEVLEQAGVKLGEDYPLPIVDLKKSRERALSAYQLMRQRR